MRNNFCLRFRKFKINIFKKVSGNDEIYDLYKKLANYYYDKYKKKEELTRLLNNLLDKDLENYDKIFNFFESIKINT